MWHAPDKKARDAALSKSCPCDISLAGGKECPWLAGRISGGSRVAGTCDRDNQVLWSMRCPGPGLGGTGRAGGAPV